MRWNEIFETSQTFYHGSSDYLPVGTVLKAGADYEDSWDGTDFYAILERYRPASMLAHKDAVFMVDNDEDIDSAGGGTEFVFTVRPDSRVEKHDMNWSSEISGLVGDGFSVDSPEIQQAAENYWNGVPHHNESLWEYLTPSAEIIAVEEF